MTPKGATSVDAEARAQMKQWLDTWKRVGPMLEAERWQRVGALTDDGAWEEGNDLLQLWEPGMTGDNGEGLLLQQLVFDRLRDR